MSNLITRRYMTVGWLSLVLLSAAAHRLRADSSRTFGTAGKEKAVLKLGVEAELFRHNGKGFLTHMWFGGDFKNYGLTRLRIYIDGEKEASIDMELMMGHGIGFQDESAPWGVERIGKTGQPSGIYNTYRIPFGSSVRITAQRQEAEENEKEVPPFWWIIRGVEGVPLEIGGVKLPEHARLRLYKVTDRATKPLEEFSMSETAKSGMLYMVTIAAKSTKYCFMESCVRAYIGGVKDPLLLSSGMEDYFLGTYDFNKGKYYTPIAGVTHLVPETEFSAYRFHEADPVFFNNGLRLTIRDGEESNGKVFGCDPQPTTFTTYVWLYEW